jgi:hypothetical protein
MADIGSFTLDLKVMMRGTTTQRTNYTNPTSGTLFYDETLNAVYEWNGSTWQLYGPMGGASGSNTPATGVPGSIARIRATLNSVSPGVIAAAGDYAAGDVLNDSTTAGHAWVLPSIARLTAGGFLAQKVLITCSVAAMVPRFRLHVFSAVPSVLQNDNVAFLLDADDRAIYLGYIDMPAMQTSGSSEIGWSESDLQWIASTSGSANLNFVLQTLDAFTNESAGMTIDVFFTGVQS